MSTSRSTSSKHAVPSRRIFLSSSAAAAAGLVLSGGARPAGAACAPCPPSGAGCDVPWLAEVQQHEGALPTGTPPLPPLLRDVQGRPIQSAAAWEARREQIRRRWLDFLGPIPPNPEPPVLEVLEEDYPPGVVRQLVAYEGEPGQVVRGYLIRPRHLDGPRPGVVVLHSTTEATIRQPAGLEGVPEKAYGLHLAQLGFVTFSPEAFLWQEPYGTLRARQSGGAGIFEQVTDAVLRRHPGSLGMAKMLFDAARGLDVLESLDEVDASRLGAAGHSLGGKEVLYLAAFDPRVQAAVSSEGGIGTGFSNWDAPWYLGAGMHDFSREHHELLALIAPRPFLLIGGDAADGAQSWPFVEAALDVYGLYNEPRRLGLLNHGQGHSVPRISEMRTYQWLLTYLQA